MSHLILTSEQAQAVLQAGAPMEVRDEQGRTLAHLTPLEPGDIEAIAQAKRALAAGGRPIPGSQVQAFLQRLAHIRRTEGLDEAKMRDLLRRLQAGERV
jgi:hypothetical protein